MNVERKQFLHDVFVTALEGGIGYWSQCSDYHWSTGPDHTPDLDGFYADIIEVGDGDDNNPFHIDRATIQRGLSLVISGGSGVHTEYEARIGVASSHNDAGDIDATDADIIVQAGLFGKVVYG